MLSTFAKLYLRNPAHAGRGVEAAIGAGEHAARIADRPRDPLDAVGDDLRVLHEVRQRVDHAGDQQLISASRIFSSTRNSCAWRGLANGRKIAPALACRMTGRMSRSATSWSCGPS